jgi:hypothetical protein
LSFCYIDGNHSYDVATRDFLNTDRFLTPGGFIIFDDSADGSEWEVCKVIQEVIESGSYDLLAKNPNYFFQKRTRVPQFELNKQMTQAKIDDSYAIGHTTSGTREKTNRLKRFKQVRINDLFRHVGQLAQKLILHCFKNLLKF